MYTQYMVMLWARDSEKHPHFKSVHTDLDFTMEKVVHHAKPDGGNAEFYKSVTIHEISIDEDNPSKMAITFIHGIALPSPKPPIEYNKPMKAAA